MKLFYVLVFYGLLAIIVTMFTIEYLWFKLNGSLTKGFTK